MAQIRTRHDERFRCRDEVFVDVDPGFHSHHRYFYHKSRGGDYVRRLLFAGHRHAPQGLHIGQGVVWRTIIEPGEGGSQSGFAYAFGGQVFDQKVGVVGNRQDFALVVPFDQRHGHAHISVGLFERGHDHPFNINILPRADGGFGQLHHEQVRYDVVFARIGDGSGAGFRPIGGHDGGYFHHSRFTICSAAVVGDQFHLLGATRQGECRHCR